MLNILCYFIRDSFGYGRHPRDPRNYMNNYSFTDPGGMEG